MLKVWSPTSQLVFKSHLYPPQSTGPLPFPFLFQARVIFDLAKAVSFIQQTDSKRWWLGLTDQFRFSPVTHKYETLKL